MKNIGLRVGEEMDRATWSRKIISRTDDPRCQEKTGGKKLSVMGLIFFIHVRVWI